MISADTLTYRRMDAEHQLDGATWLIGEAAAIGTQIDVPSHMLDGPVGVFDGDEIVAVVGRSMDLPPFSVFVREDLSSGAEAHVSIRMTGNMTVRAEVNPAQVAAPGREPKPETDFLIVQGPTGLLVRIA